MTLLAAEPASRLDDGPHEAQRPVGRRSAPRDLVVVPAYLWWALPLTHATGGRSVGREAVLALLLAVAVVTLTPWRLLPRTVHRGRGGSRRGSGTRAGLLRHRPAGVRRRPELCLRGDGIPRGGRLGDHRDQEDRARRRHLARHPRSDESGPAAVVGWGETRPCNSSEPSSGATPSPPTWSPAYSSDLPLPCGRVRPWRLVGWVMAPLGVAGVVLSTSRATLAVLMVGVGVVGVLVVAARKGRGPRLLGTPGCAASAPSCPGACRGRRCSHTAVAALQATGARSAAGETLSANGSYRLEFWREALDVLRHHPLVGSGFHGLVEGNLPYTAASWARSPWAHNGYLQALSDGGLLLGVPLIAGSALLAWYAAATLWRGWRGTGEPVRQLVAIAVLALLAPLRGRLRLELPLALRDVRRVRRPPRGPDRAPRRPHRIVPVTDRARPHALTLLGLSVGPLALRAEPVTMPAGVSLPGTVQRLADSARRPLVGDADARLLLGLAISEPGTVTVGDRRLAIAKTAREATIDLSLAAQRGRVAVTVGETSIADDAVRQFTTSGDAASTLLTAYAPLLASLGRWARGGRPAQPGPRARPAGRRQRLRQPRRRLDRQRSGERRRSAVPHCCRPRPAEAGDLFTAGLPRGDAVKQLGDILVESGMVSTDQLRMALSEQQRLGRSLGRVLVDMGYLTESQLVAALATQIGLPFADLSDYPVDAGAVVLLPDAVARRHTALPIGFDDGRLVVAMADPANVFALDDIRSITRREIKPVVATKADLVAAINRYHRMEGELDDLTTSIDHAEEEAGLSAVKEIVDDAPIVKFVNLLINQAIQDRASDIHIEPTERDLRVRFRIDGVLHEVMRSPKSIASGVISRLKIMADIDIAERRVPQDGRLSVTAAGKKIDLRVASLPVVWGEKIVMRILDNTTAMMKLSDLGFRDDNFTPLGEVLHQALRHAARDRAHGIRQVDDALRHAQHRQQTRDQRHHGRGPGRIPDSRNQPGPGQPQGRSDFARALRSILRSDPDVVLIGEIRDHETAQIAIEAALTGHLVLSPRCTPTTRRARSPGSPRWGSSPSWSPPRSTPCSPSVWPASSVRSARSLCADGEGAGRGPLARPGCRMPTELFRQVGCSACSKTGYKGRLALHEVMAVTEGIERTGGDQGQRRGHGPARPRSGHADAARRRAGQGRAGADDARGDLPCRRLSPVVTRPAQARSASTDRSNGR